MLSAVNCHRAPPSPLWGCLGSKYFRILGSGTGMSRKYVLLKNLVPSVSFETGCGGLGFGVLGFGICGGARR